MPVEKRITRSRIEEALSWRYAVKKFDATKQLTNQQLDSVLAALQLTPTSMGLQLMKFIVIKDQKLKELIVPLAYNQYQVADCSHLLVLCRVDEVREEHITSYVEQTAATRNITVPSSQLEGFESMLRSTLKMSHEQQVKWMDNQVYLALGNLLTACAVEGIDACPMEGFMPDRVNELLNLSEKGLRSVILCPIGFRSAEDKYATFPKVRRSAGELIEYL